jgi:hypothetical protein
MAPLPEPGQHNGCTDQQGQESRDNLLLGRNINSLHYLYRIPRQPTPEMRSRSSRPFSAAEQDNFLADTLSAAWQLALESQAYFDNDSSNHTATSTTTTTTMETTTSGRQHVHNNTDLDHQDDSGDNTTDLDRNEDSGNIPSIQ